MKRNSLAFIFILIVGSVLRLYGLAFQSLRNDELSSWWRSHFDNLTEVIHTGVVPDVHPPGYQVLLHFVEKHIGMSETALRFPSALAGILSIVMIYLLARRLYSVREALISSAILAIAWCPIYYSQDARSYSLLLLFSMITAYFWVDLTSALRGDEKIPKAAAAAYILSASICSYLHYYGVYLVALQGVVLILALAHKPRVLVKGISIYAIIAVTYIPWLPFMLGEFDRQTTIYTPPKASNFLELLEFFFNRWKTLSHVVLGSYVLLIILEGVRFFRSNRRIENNAVVFNPTTVLISWLVLPLAGIVLISLLWLPIINYHSLIISLPAAYILFARAVSRVLPRHRLQLAAFTLFAGCLVYHLFFSKRYYTAPHKAQFREAVKHIVDNDRLYSDSMIFGHAWSVEYFNYYFRKFDSDRRIDMKGGSRTDIRDAAGAIEQKNPKYIWFINAHRQPEPEWMESMNERYSLIDHKKLVHANVWLFENVSSP